MAPGPPVPAQGQAGAGQAGPGRVPLAVPAAPAVSPGVLAALGAAHGAAVVAVLALPRAETAAQGAGACGTGTVGDTKGHRGVALASVIILAPRGDGTVGVSHWE